LAFPALVALVALVVPERRAVLRVLAGEVRQEKALPWVERKRCTQVPVRQGEWT